MVPATELRGPCNALFGDVAGGVLWVRCRRCTQRRNGRPCYHLFDTSTGALVPPAKIGAAIAARGARPGRDLVE